MLSFTVHPIGVIHSPFAEQADTPIQPAYAEGAEGSLVLFDEYAEALKDLEGFERIWVIFLFHHAREFTPLVVPYRDDTLRGLFATRAPSLPNPIGLSALRLLAVEGRRVHVATPLLDIKPYVPRVDAHRGSKAGWLDLPSTRRRRADGRFEKP